MIQGKLLSYGDDLSEVYNIRKKVFVDEMGVSEDIEFDGMDNEAIHVLVYEEASNTNNHESIKEKIPVATGRIEYKGDHCKIGHVAVLKEFRDLEFGDFTVKMLINRAFTANVKIVTLTCKSEVEGFFYKVGFETESYNSNINEVHMKISEKDIKRACNR